jgi:hypothetical protein
MQALRWTLHWIPAFAGMMKGMTETHDQPFDKDVSR